MKSKYIYLNLFLIDFPITALTSIVHRISGILLFIGMPFFLYFFYLSIESESSFKISQTLLSLIYIKILFKIFFCSFIYHFLYGLKHIVIDVGYFDGKESARKFSIITLLITLFFVFLSILL